MFYSHHRAINFWQTNVLSRDGNQQGVYLSGLSSPALEKPPLPYSTTPAPPTTPQPTCSIPYVFSSGNFYSWLGDTPVSFATYNSSALLGIYTYA